MIDFSKFAKIVRSDTLPDAGRNGVLSPRSISIRADGKLLIVDARARRVSLRSTSLGEATIVGREGEGPGEYRLPSSGAFGPGGGILVSDMALSQISLYRPDGSFERRLAGIPTNIRSLVPVDGGILLLGIVPTRGGNLMATVVDDDGKRRWQGVPADPVLQATGLVADGVWGAVEKSGSVLIGASISPRIHRVNAANGTIICTTLLPSSLWTQLDPKKRPVNGTLAATREWIDRASRVQRVQTLSDSRVVAALERVGSGEQSFNDWVVFSQSISPALHVSNVPGRLALVHGDTIWLTDATNMGKVVIHRATLVGR